MAVRLALLATVLLTLAGTAAAGIGSSPRTLAGAWSGTYSGAVTGRFTLHWKQSGVTLRGSITLSSPPGTYGISGAVHGGAIRFGAVGVGATYSGSVSGKTMSGKWNSPQGGGAWSAHKTS